MATKWEEENQARVEARADEILAKSKYKDFEAEESEVDGSWVKYFDALGNVVKVGTRSGEVVYIPASEVCCG